jgi:predicted O-methyltransferase YrrM
MDSVKAFQFVVERFCNQDPVFAEVFKSILDLGMPDISLNPVAGKLLTLLTKMTNAERVLEVGSLGGYSGVCLAKGMQEDGEFVALELNADYARMAEGFVRKAGFKGNIRYLVGPALDGLRTLKAEGKAFDLVFIDADKEHYPDYLSGSLELAHAGSVIVADNALWKGRVFDPAQSSADTEGVRAFNRMLQEHPRLDSIVLPFGDGFALAFVRG